MTDKIYLKLGHVVNQEINPVLYLAIDPGKANGVCGYDAKFYPVFMLTVPADDMVDFLEQFTAVTVCITENYLLFPSKTKSQIYSDMETPRVIGRIEGWASRHRVKLVMQAPNIKTLGYKWIGKKPLPKSNSLNHQLDAHVHGMYWAVRNGKVNAADLLRNNP